ncbi:MAG: hypothetical protein NF693_01130 [Bombella sp.]|nr:hypothetical protein [Bombella sp.]
MKLVSQTPVTPGQPSTATVLGQDENGNVTPVSLELPPGKAADIPENVALKTDLTEFVSGTAWMGPQDKPVFAIHLNGTNNSVLMVLGDRQAPIYKTALTLDYSQFLLKNGLSPIKYGVAQNVVHGTLVQFPQAYTDDNVTVVVCGTDGGSGRIRFPQISGSPNRNGFQLSLNYWNGSGIVNETTPCTIYYIAIGAT